MAYANANLNPINMKHATSKMRKVQDAATTPAEKRAIPYVQAQRVQQVGLTDMSMLIHGVKDIEKPSNYVANPKLPGFYKDFAEHALFSLTGKKSSAQWLHQATIDMQGKLHYAFNSKAKSYSSFTEVKSSYEHLQQYLNGHGSLAVIDIEAFSGKNAYGQQDFDSITEYAARIYDHAGNVSQEFTGVVGISERDYKKYEKIIQKYGDSGVLEQKDRIALEYFAKVGDNGTNITKKAPGHWTVDRYTNAENIMTRENMLMGLERMRDIGLEQELTADPSGIKTWQKHFRTMTDVLEKGAQAGDMVIAGHNIKAYDIANINRVRARQGMAPLNIPGESIYDLLPQVQHASGDLNFAATIHGRNQAHLKGASPLQQTSLVKSLLGTDYYEKSGMGAHSALADTQAFFDLIKNGKVGKQSFVDYAYNTAARVSSSGVSGSLIGGQKQLYYAAGRGSGRENVLGFTVDQFSGAIHTADGFMINPNGKVRKTFAESPIKRGMTYTIDSITGLPMDNEYVQRMREIYPALAVNDLVMVKMNPYLDESVTGADLAYKGNLETYMIGTAEDITSRFNNDMILFGQQDETGAMRMVLGASDLLEKFEITQGDSALELKQVADDSLLQSVVREGTEAYMNDSAARMFREDSYKRYSAFGRLSDTIAQAVATDGGVEDIAVKKKRAITNMLAMSQQMASQTAGGKSVSVGKQSAINHTLQEIVGYTDKFTGQKSVYRHTVDNFLAGLEHYESISGDVKHLIGKVDTLAQSMGEGKDKEAYKAFIFKQGLDAIQGSALEELQKNSIDMKPGFVRGYEKDFFDVDITAMTGKRKSTRLSKAVENINPENIMSINLRAGGEYGLIDELLKRSGVNPQAYNAETEAKKRLNMFVDHLSTQKIFSKNQAEIMRKNMAEYHPTIMAQQIIETLRQYREANPTAGILSPDSVQNVLGQSELSRTGSGIFSTEQLNGILGFLDDKAYAPENFHALVAGDAGKDSRKALAGQLVDRFLVENPSEESLRSYGYNDRIIKKLDILKRAHRQDALRMMEEVLDAASITNAKIYADKHYNRFGLIINDQFHDLSSIPRLRFRDGMYYTQLGRTNVSAHLRLHSNGRATGAGFSLKSSVGEALDGSYNLKRMVENAIANGEDIGEKFRVYTNQIVGSIRNGSERGGLSGGAVILNFDEQDVKSQLELEYRNVVDKLPELEKKGFFHGYEFYNQEKFLSTIRSKNYSFEKLNNTKRQLLMKNLPTVFEAIRDSDISADIESLLGDANFGAKASAAEAGRVRVDPMTLAFEGWNRGSRGIENQNRFMPYSRQTAEVAVKALGLENHVILGNQIMSRAGFGISERAREGMSASDRALSEVMTSRAYLTPAGLRQKIEQYKLKEGIGEAHKKAADVLSNVAQLEEGGAVADARLADSVFKQYHIQKINFSKQLADEHEFNMAMIDKTKKYDELVPEIHFNPDGTIKFKYRRGTLVKANESLMALEGFGGADVVKAKTEGTMRFGFFVKGTDMLADEQAVSESIINYSKKSGRKISDLNEFMTVANDIYDASFYVDRLHANGYRKLVENRLEKHMTSFGYLGLGASGDTRIRNVLVTLGLKGRMSEVLNYGVFQEFENEERIGKGILSLLAGESGNKLTKGQYVNAIKDAGYGSVKEFYDALKAERYMPSEILQNITGASVALQHDTFKHGSRITAIKQGTYEMIINRVNKGLSLDAAHTEVFNIIKDAYVGNDGAPGLSLENGRITLNEMFFEKGGHIDYGAARNAISDDLGKVVRRDANGNLKEIYRFDTLLRPDEVTYSTFGLSHDWSEESFNKSKIAGREINMLNFPTYTQKSIEEAFNSIGDEKQFKRVFGHVADVIDGKPVIKAEAAGVNVLKSYTDQIKNQLFMTAGEEEITRGQMIGSPHLKSAVRAIRGIGGDNVPISLRRAEEVYAAASGIAAIAHNNGENNTKELKDMHFVNRSLADLDRATGGDADYLHRENMVVNLKDDIIGEDIFKNIEGIKDGKIAVAAGVPRQAGSEAIIPEYQKHLNSLIRTRNQLASELNRGTDRNTKEIGRLRERFVSEASKLNQAQSAYVTGNKTALMRSLGRVTMDKSTIGKASVMGVDTGSAMLKTAKIEGKTLAEHYSNGHYFNAKFLSEQTFANMGFFDEAYMKSVGVETKEAMRSKLMTEGVAAFSHRYPTIYKGSIHATQAYIGEGLLGNQAVEVVHGALFAKMDSDGDLSETIIARYSKDRNTIYDSLQAAHNGVSDAAERGFQDFQAQMYRQAYVENPRAMEYLERQAAKNDNIIKSVDELALADSIGTTMYPRLSRMATSEEVARYQEQFGRLNENAIQRAMQTGLTQDETEQLFRTNWEKHRGYLQQALGDVSGEEYEKAAAWRVQYIRDLAAGMGNVKRAAAGEMNLPNYQIRKLREMAKDHKILGEHEQNVLEAMLEGAEEGFLTPKHEEAVLIDQFDVMEKYNKALRSLSGNIRMGETAGTDEMKSWLMEHAIPRMEANKRRAIYGLSNVSDEAMVNTAAEAMQKIFNSSDTLSEYNNFLSQVGATKRGVDARFIRDAYLVPGEDNTLEGVSAKAIGSMLGRNQEDVEKMMRDNTSPITEKAVSTEMSSARAALSNYDNSILGKIRTTVEKFGLTGKKTAIVAAGLAGATMIAGFVGGNPSVPAEQHAKQQADDDEYYKIPTLTDTNVAKRTGNGPTRGYVININAQSEHGKQHAMDAINQAMGQSFSRTNVNISMNIRDNQRNITDGNIAQMIQGALN